MLRPTYLSAVPATFWRSPTSGPHGGVEAERGSMRILIYAHSFAPKIGGAETYVMLLTEGLAARPEVRQVTVATPTPAGGFDDAPLPFRVVRRPSVRSLWRLVCQADVVLLAGPCLVPLAMARARHRPTAVEHHGYQAVCPNGLLFQ